MVNTNFHVDGKYWYDKKGDLNELEYIEVISYHTLFISVKATTISPRLFGQTVFLPLLAAPALLQFEPVSDVPGGRKSTIIMILD